MPIVNDEDLTATVVAPPKLQIAAPEYRGVVVDTRHESLSNLLTHIEGSSWTATYYSQVLNDDSQVQGQQVTLDPIYQQYRLVRDFELKVSSPLSTSQDEQTGSMQVRGSANAYPVLIPNVGDQFLADIGDGREGIFKVISSEAKSIYKTKCYAIEYVLVDYSTEERRGDLNAKTVQTLHFSRDMLNYGQYPLIEEEAYHQHEKLVAHYKELTGIYFQSFTSAETRTLVVPGQPELTYDHFLNQAMRSYFNTWDAPELISMRTMNVGEDAALKSITLWTVLGQRAPKLLKLAAREMGLVSTRMFNKAPMHEGIYWSQLQKVVYPKEPTTTVNFEAAVLPKIVSDDVLVNSPSQIRNLADLLTQTELDGLPYIGAPLLHPVTMDSCYVFSQAFYERAALGQSKLELLVHDYLDGKAIDRKVLLALCETVHSWGGLERFYYLPVVLLLIKATVRTI